MIKHIIWDWNGTLLDDVQPCVDAINQMMTTRQLPSLNRERYRNIFDFPVIRYYEKLGFDIEAEDWDAMANEFHRYYGEYSTNSALRVGVEETLNRISELGVPMSILSASEITLLERMLEERGIRQLFEYVVGLNDRHASSKLEQGRNLLRTLALPPNELLLIGDTNHDHDVAKDLGIHCMLLTGGHQSEHRLKAKRILEHPLELLTFAEYISAR